MGVLGELAERQVEERIRAALPDGVRCFANVRWLAPMRDGGAAREGRPCAVTANLTRQGPRMGRE